MSYGEIAHEKRKFGAPALRVIELANAICAESIDTPGPCAPRGTVPSLVS